MAETTWKSLRDTLGLSQREVERRLDWKRGHLSLIERGFPPTDEQSRQLLRFYFGTADLSQPTARIAE